MDGWMDGEVEVEAKGWWWRSGDLRPALTPANPAQAGTILIGREVGG